MKILYVGTYASWEKISIGQMPSQHMFGIHEMIDHYEDNHGKIRGILTRGGTLTSYS